MANKADNLLVCEPDTGTHEKIPSRCELCAVLEFTVCGGLTYEELARFGAATKAVQMPKGARLIYDGDIDRLIFTVTGGCLKSYKQLADGRRQITGFYFPGDFIGLTQSDTYLADVEAVKDSSVCQMHRTDLALLSKAIPNVDRRLYDLSSSALSSMQGQIVLLGRKTAQERVATFLLMLSERASERGGVTNPVDVPMTRQDIADFLGLTIETVSRTYSTLRKLDLIGADSEGSIELLDRDGLGRVAD